MGVLSPQRVHIEPEEKLNQENLKAAVRALNEKVKYYENVETDKKIIE